METKEKGNTVSVVKLVDYTISICRVCTLSTQCQNIFAMNYSDLTFADLFYYATRIQLSADDNPYYVCLMCIGKLLNAYEFIIQCEKSWYAQKQVRMSAQIDSTTNAQNIVIVNNNIDNVIVKESPKSKKNTKHCKPIAPKTTSMIIDVINDNIDLSTLPTKVQNSEESVQELILITNEDGFIQGTIENIDLKKRTSYDGLEMDEKPLEGSTNNDINIETDESAAVNDSILYEEDVLKSSENEPNAFEYMLAELAEAEIDLSYTKNGDNSTDDRTRKRDNDGPPYKCVKCGRKFQKVNSLNRHLLGHLSSGHYCKQCGQEFSNKMNLNKHMQMHLKERRTVCEHCGKTFRGKVTLRNHQKSKHAQKLKSPRHERCCKICSHSFTSAQELRAHISSEHNRTDQLCNVCGKTFRGLVNLKKHMVRHDERRRVTCGICDKTFRSRDILKQHIYTHTGVKPYQCHICGKRCTQSQQLKSHIRMHTGEKPYSCKYCGNSFTTSASLVTHVRARHTNVRPHTCQACGKSFTQNAALTRHLRTHTRALNKNGQGDYNSENMLTCTLCEVPFPSKGALLRHKCTHIHLAPYACEICDKRFRFKQLLTVHTRIHTGERPFKCKLCQQAFRSTASLKEHMYRHTGEKRFVCDICGKGCTQRQQLVSHMRIHTGVKPYKCDICSKTFSMKGNLTVHIRTHTGETPYTCDICGAGFCASNALRRHQAKCQYTVIVYEDAENNVPEYAESNNEVDNEVKVF